MPKKKQKILIVDDNESMLDLMESIFESTKYQTVRASTGEEAIDILKVKDIMVMYVDISLPGISGVDLCQRIRKDNPVAFVYAITGHIEKFDVFDCRHFGFDDYFEKPFSPKDIIAAAREAFRKLKRWNHY